LLTVTINSSTFRAELSGRRGRKEKGHPEGEKKESGSCAGRLAGGYLKFSAAAAEAWRGREKSIEKGGRRRGKEGTRRTSPFHS